MPERFLINPRKREFGDFAMWDLPAFEFKDGQIHSRACDDLLGCAEIICLFRELEAAKANVHCLGLFTRAEEVGFWGAIQLARSGILPKNITIFSLETSTPRGGAEIGRGPIVRVGDRLSIFDSGETLRIMNVAAANGIPVQRCLLDGGSCEASAYQVYGYRSVAASIALGNYHNCTPDGSDRMRIRVRGRLCEYGPALCRAGARGEIARSSEGLSRDSGKESGGLCAILPAASALVAPALFAAEQDDDFLIAARQDHPAVFDRFDRELIGLVAELQSKLLTLLHRFAIDDGETRAPLSKVIELTTKAAG